MSIALLQHLVCASTSVPKNVLFIAVDDMRPSIGAFNFSLAHTPNLDKLGATGTIFKRAYVQYAFCAPSRNSFMSGRRPDTTRVWNFVDHFREQEVGATWTALPEYFKKHGFVTMGSGKLYHPNVPPDNGECSRLCTARARTPHTHSPILSARLAKVVESAERNGGPAVLLPRVRGFGQWLVPLPEFTPSHEPNSARPERAFPLRIARPPGEWIHAVRRQHDEKGGSF